MLLSDRAILRHMKMGTVVIDPFVHQRLNNASYDLSLGPWVARYKHGPRKPVRPHEDVDLFDLYDSTENGGYTLKSGERVLGHTRERVGGTIAKDPNNSRVYAVNSSLHATSTAQRIGISVCLDAGWGDVGFVQIFCLEITNHSPFDVFLPTGAIVSQITFHECEPPSRLYREQGSYKGEGEWAPEQMLPKRMKVALTPDAESRRI